MKLPTFLIVSTILLFASCNEQPVSHWAPIDPPDPPPTYRAPVHFAVGNMYNWRVRQIGIGTYFQWNEQTRILSDTVLHGRTYYVFDDGKFLRSSNDTVFSFSQNSQSIYYHLDVSVGDTVPFMGYRFIVSEVDTQEVFGDLQTVVTLDNNIDSTTNISSTRFASKFGIISLNTVGFSVSTLTSLLGAQLGSSVYGSTQLNVLPQ